MKFNLSSVIILWQVDAMPEYVHLTSSFLVVCRSHLKVLVGLEAKSGL